MKKSFITIPIIVVLVVAMIFSVLLMNRKPDTSHVSTAQKIAEYSKPAVVRVYDYAIVKWKFYNNYDYEVVEFFQMIQNQSIIGGAGSGAIISSNGYIVTNAHVVEVAKMEEQQIANMAFEQICRQLAAYFGIPLEVTKQYMLQYTEWESVTKVLKVVLPGGEILDAEVKSYGAPIGEGKDVAVLKVEGKNLPTITLGDSDKVKLQDNVWVVGYPGAGDSDLLSPDSTLVASITDGRVSATDKKSAQGASVIQISAASTHGNSGGPVITEDGTVIGLLTFRGDTVNGQEIQGFNFVVPVNTVKEFVNASGGKNEAGAVDRLYKEGLELYWGGYYKDALVKFEEVQRLFPGHSEIKKLIMESQQKSPDSKILWSKYKYSFIGFDAAALLAIILLLFFTFFNKKTTPALIGVGESDNQDIEEKEENKGE